MRIRVVRATDGTAKKCNRYNFPQKYNVRSRTMKAFIGHNFNEKDDDLVGKIQEFIETFDIECIGGKRSESKPISQKVKERIESCDIFHRNL